MQISAIRFEWPALILGIIVATTYWLPMFWWLFYIATGGIEWPEGLPFWSLAMHTSYLCLFSTILAIIISYPFVIVWRFSNAVVNKCITALMIIPLIMGLLARNYSWIGLLTNQGSFGTLGRRILGDDFLFSSYAIILVMAVIFVPVAFFILIQATRSIRSEHIEAARTLGVPDWRILFVVVLPITYRAAILAAGFIFALSVGFFVTPSMIGGGNYDFIGNAVLLYVNLGDFQKASTLALAFLGLTILPVIGVTILSLRRRTLISGR